MKLKAGIIGLGVGESHIEGYQAHPQCEVTHLCDLSESKLNEARKKYPTLHLINMNTGQDHVHLQIEIPPNIAVCDAVGKLKANASGHLRRKFKYIRDIYLEKDGIWSVGYFSSTIGLNEAQIKRYIDFQSKHDKVQTIDLFSNLGKQD